MNSWLGYLPWPTANAVFMLEHNKLHTLLPTNQMNMWHLAVTLLI